MLPAALSHRSFSTSTLLFSATSGHKMQQLSVWVWDRCWSSFWVVFGRKKGHVNYEVYPCHSASHSLIILLSAQAEQKMLCLILSALFGTKKRWKRMESVLSCFMGITLTSADLWIRRWPMSDHNQMGSQRSLQLSICVFFFSDEMPHKAVRRRDAAIVITTPFPLKVNSAIKENTFGTQNCTKRSQSIRNSKWVFFFLGYKSIWQGTTPIGHNHSLDHGAEQNFYGRFPCLNQLESPWKLDELEEPTTIDQLEEQMPLMISQSTHFPALNSLEGDLNRRALSEKKEERTARPVELH